MTNCAYPLLYEIWVSAQGRNKMKPSVWIKNKLDIKEIDMVIEAELDKRFFDIEDIEKIILNTKDTNSLLDALKRSKTIFKIKGLNKEHKANKEFNKFMNKKMEVKK
jgi:hypothetical protein